MRIYNQSTSCLPPVDPIARGFIRHLQSLPQFTLSYDFDTIRALLIQYVRKNYPDWVDFIESATGMMFLEWVAYIAVMNAFRSDFLRSQTFIDTVSDLNMLSRNMLLTGQTLNTPSASFLTQVNQNTTAVQARFLRSPNSYGDVNIYAGTSISVNTDVGAVNYELFQLDENYAPIYTAAFSPSPIGFTVVNSGLVSSDPTSGTVFPVPPSAPWVLIEGRTYVESFISDESPFQSFDLSHFPIITDYVNNWRSSVQIIYNDTGFVDTEWYEVDDLLHSTANDKHYQLEWDGSFRTRLMFGNGIYGSVPPKGTNIQICYRVGGGPAKSISSGQLAQTIPAFDDQGQTSLTLVNLAPTSPGGSGDTLLKAKAYYGPRVRRQNRLVSGEDFVSFAEDFPGIAKATADLLANDASGNLVRMRIMEYQTTSEGYFRPSEGQNQISLEYQGLGYNAVSSVIYNSITQRTRIELLYPLGSTFMSSYRGLDVAGANYNDPSQFSFNLISRLGMSRKFIIPLDMLPQATSLTASNITTSSVNTIEIIGEDCTDLFPPGTLVGITILNEPNFMLAVPEATPNTFNIPGLSMTLYGNSYWPGGANTVGYAQIDNEFIQFCASIDPYPLGCISQTSSQNSSGSSCQWWNDVNNSFTNVFDIGCDTSASGSTAIPYQIRLLNVLSRGTYGTQVSPHPIGSRLYLGGVRPDLYTAMSKYKVEPSELLILEGRLQPIYMKLSIVLQQSSTIIQENVRLALEQYFNFIESRWGFGKELDVSTLLTAIQNIAGVKSVTFIHASQYTMDPTSSIIIDENISSVPNDTCLGLLPYQTAIGQKNDVISTDNNKIFRLSADINSETPTNIVLSTVSGSDFSYLPNAALLKIRDEVIAYRYRTGNVLSGITRHIYNSGDLTNARNYYASQNDPVYLVPNILMSFSTDRS